MVRSLKLWIKEVEGLYFLTAQLIRAFVFADFFMTRLNYTPNGFIVPMEFRIHFFPRISAFSRHTKMHLNGMFLIGNEFFKIIVPL